ncbi:MAG: ABC transporter ATP-binding protein [Thermodesulfobacteriota bacterium]
MEKLLSVQDLKVSFSSGDMIAKAVDDLSYDVHQGETVCIVGESGCGKTVSTLAILGLIPRPPGRIEQGRIVFAGRDLLCLREDELRFIRGKRIGMIFQDPLTSLNPVFTVKEQIQETILAHEILEQKYLKPRLLELLDNVGLPSPETILTSYPHQLSGGQRQRVMIAMAMSCNPELIIADEPTTALDVTVQAQIIKLFKSTIQDGSRSILYITHDLGVVANLAQRVYVMYAGLVVEQGPVREVIRDPAHPYTRGLLASLPGTAKRGTLLPSIPGTVPAPFLRPSGCPFHPRCSIWQESCRVHRPRLEPCGPGHFSRCPVLDRNKTWKRCGPVSENA